MLTNRRQVQDLERQLFQTRQQVEQLKAVMAKDELSTAMDISSPKQLGRDVPAMGSLPRKRTKPPPVQDFSRVRSNIRKYGRGLFKAPTPYRQICLHQGQTFEMPPLPPKHIADRLLVQYFSHVHLRFPVIHQPTFYNEYQKAYQDGTFTGLSRGWVAVLFCVLACGSLYTAEASRLQDGKEYLTKGTATIDFWTDELTVDQAKMNFLVSVFLIESNLKSAGWVWLGAAARIAQDIGLHVETGPWPMIEGEVWRRTWYCIYALDRWVHTARKAQEEC